MRLWLAILFMPLLAWADDAFPVARRSGLPGNLWTSAGIAGGIPYATTIFTNLPTGTTLAQLNAWIAACPSNQVVKLEAGVFDLGGIVNLTKNGVVLRGTTNANGVPATFLTNAQVTFNGYGICGGDGFTNGPSPSVTINSVLSGYTEGSTAITLSNSPGVAFVVGNLFVLDQIYDGTLVYQDLQTGWYIRYGRPYSQALFITNIVDNTLHFVPPLCGYYWTNTQAPQAYGWADHQNTRRRTGLEDVDIVRGSASEQGQGVRIHDVYECWVRNVRVKQQSYSAIDLSWGVNSEVRHCTSHDAIWANSGYSIAAVLATACRIEDNLTTNGSAIVVLSSAVGCSVSYNVGMPPYYSNPGDPTWFYEYMFTHGGHCHHNLFEGNWLDGPLEFDDVFKQNTSDNGIVRSRLRGWSEGFSGNCAGFIVGEPGSSYPDSDQRNVTAIGNLLGSDGFHTGTTYYYKKAACTGLVMTNNYNTVDDGIPTGEAIGANTMRDSYAYNARPAWFGNLAWPPFSPTNFAGCTISNIPAGYRATFGSDPPSAQTGRPLALRVGGQATIRSATIR